MAKHENPQAPPQIYYPAGHPKHVPPKPPTPATGRVEQTAQQASVQNAINSASRSPREPNDLGDVIRGIAELAAELHEAFFNVPDVADERGVVDPEKFDTATRYAFVSCGNALDYAIRLVSEKGRGLRILKLRRELAEEMRAAGLTGDPLDGESATPQPPEQVG